MALPTAYTDATISQYMVDQLGEIAGVLGWTWDTDLHEAINETLLAYGVDTLEEASDLRKLRTLARWQAWRAAVDSLVARYHFSNPEGSYSREQMLAGARAILADAEADASAYVDTAWAMVRVTNIKRNDPYLPEVLP